MKSIWQIIPDILLLDHTPSTHSRSSNTIPLRNRRRERWTNNILSTLFVFIFINPANIGTRKHALLDAKIQRKKRAKKWTGLYSLFRWVFDSSMYIKFVKCRSSSGRQGQVCARVRRAFQAMYIQQWHDDVLLGTVHSSTRRVWPSHHVSSTERVRQ